MKRTDLDILHSLTEADVRDMFYGKVWQRAKTYHGERRVQSARRHGPALTAQVQGTHLYDVYLGVERRHLSWSCTCPFADSGICKHVGAVLLQ
ncbi:MAG TPA: SWIM zinc finger family protein, partial [Anaerolineae bacterium]|nr:SWIM zinc finger family protein [Anaerolineae bacterium]